MTTLEQIEWSTADNECDESDVWLQRSIGHSGVSEFIGTVEEMIDVSLHNEREDTDWEAEIDKSLSFNVMLSYFKFNVWNDKEEWSDVWTDSFWEWFEVRCCEKFGERILSLLSLWDGGV